MTSNALLCGHHISSDQYSNEVTTYNTMLSHPLIVLYNIFWISRYFSLLWQNLWIRLIEALCNVLFGLSVSRGTNQTTNLWSEWGFILFRQPFFLLHSGLKQSTMSPAVIHNHRLGRREHYTWLCGECVGRENSKTVFMNTNSLCVVNLVVMKLTLGCRHVDILTNAAAAGD